MCVLVRRRLKQNRIKSRVQIWFSRASIEWSKSFWCTREVLGHEFFPFLCPWDDPAFFMIELWEFGVCPSWPWSIVEDNWVYWRPGPALGPATKWWGRVIALVRYFFISRANDNATKKNKKMAEYTGTNRDLVLPRFYSYHFFPHGEKFYTKIFVGTFPISWVKMTIVFGAISINLKSSIKLCWWLSMKQSISTATPKGACWQ